MNSHARIFIVDAEASTALKLAEHLQQLGYDMCGRADSAEEALERIPGARPDVVLIDLTGDAGRSGLDVAERLRPGCGSAFIFLTADPDPALVARAARVGTVAVLPTPSQIPVLAAQIEVTLAARAAQARLVDLTRELQESEARHRLWSEERRALEAQLRHAQKMEAVGALASGIAHDFNNLLATIVANLELARMDIEAPHPATESLEAIGVAAERARQLVQQILAFSRRSPPLRTVVAPRALVEETVRLLRATVPKGIAITTLVADDVPDVFVDSTQIHQVLMNLGTNAWHAIDRGLGTIAVRVDGLSMAEGDVGYGALPPGRYARVVVQDDGRGMSQETLDRIFEPFFTTKSAGRGSGLGLSVVRGIVAGHGGAVAVASAPGAGTTVTVYLPESRASRAESARLADPVRTGAGRVGFLDDESAMAVAARRLLTRLGYVSTEYESPDALLEALRADPSRFDVIVTDCNMPGMSGLDVARAVTRLRADLPVVLISGFSDRTEEDISASGIHFRLDKPFTAQELDQVLRRALSRG